MKQTTIPGSEPTAAAVAVKVDKMMRDELKIPLKESPFWSDNTTVLIYIVTLSARFKTLVANGVLLIRDHFKVSQQRYVNSELNPAGYSCRRMKANLSNKSWIQRPDFLGKNCNYWPASPMSGSFKFFVYLFNLYYTRQNIKNSFLFRMLA